MMSHEKYRARVKAFDIGIIWLKTFLRLSTTVKLLKLPSKKDKYRVGDRGLVSGFGLIDDVMKVRPNRLMSVRIPLISTRWCKKLVKLVPNAICAACEGGGCDSCKVSYNIICFHVVINEILFFLG